MIRWLLRRRHRLIFRIYKIKISSFMFSDRQECEKVFFTKNFQMAILLPSAQTQIGIFPHQRQEETFVVARIVPCRASLERDHQGLTTSRRRQTRIAAEFASWCIGELFIEAVKGCADAAAPRSGSLGSPPNPATPVRQVHAFCGERLPKLCSMGATVQEWPTLP